METCWQEDPHDPFSRPEAAPWTAAPGDPHTQRPHPAQGTKNPHLRVIQDQLLSQSQVSPRAPRGTPSHPHPPDTGPCGAGEGDPCPERLGLKEAGQCGCSLPISHTAAPRPDPPRRDSLPCGRRVGGLATRVLWTFLLPVRAFLVWGHWLGARGLWAAARPCPAGVTEHKDCGPHPQMPFSLQLLRPPARMWAAPWGWAPSPSLSQLPGPVPGPVPPPP